MPIKIDFDEAREILAMAVEDSKRHPGLPVEWVSHSRTVLDLESKTYTAALATLLLAKATNANVDTLSIKVTDDARSYSIRGLGHQVVVPGAIEHGFTLRVTGREPLNNQPWFRYNRIDEFERVRVRSDYEYFLEVARRANDLGAEEARLALAAFLKVSIERLAKVKVVSIKPGSLTAEGMRIAVEDFLRADAQDRPGRLQAFAAACLDLLHDDVRARRLNDPSRDFPGDVHSYSAGVPILAVEVRGKPVSESEVDGYMEACHASGIDRAAILVDSAMHRPIDLSRLTSDPYRRGIIQLMLFESAGDLLEQCLAWTSSSSAFGASKLAERALDRLREIESKKSTLDEWVRAVALVQSR